MKLSSPAFIVSLLFSAVIGISVAAPCLQGSFDLEVNLVENATVSQSCKPEFFSAIKAKLAAAGCDTRRGNAARNELKELLDLGNENLSRYIISVCNQARTRQEAAETLETIVDRASRKIELKEYVDGRGWPNEEIGSLAVDGQFIANVFADVAQDKLIEFPSDVYNFQSCRSNAVMCCWVQDRHNENAVNNGNCRAPYPENCIDKDPADNTDVCYVDMSRSPKSNHVAGGKALYHDNFDQSDSQTEGKSHCHGFAWKNDRDSPSFVYRGNNLFYVSLYDHFHQRGYVRNIPGAPMCSCTEKAAIVSRSDCTEMQVTETITFSYDASTRGLEARITNVDIAYNGCTGLRKDNDLASYYERLVQDGDVSTRKQANFNKTVVGENQCPSAILSFMESKGWQRIPV